MLDFDKEGQGDVRGEEDVRKIRRESVVQANTTGDLFPQPSLFLFPDSSRREVRRAACNRGQQYGMEEQAGFSLFVQACRRLLSGCAPPLLVCYLTFAAIRSHIMFIRVQIFSV